MGPVGATASGRVCVKHRNPPNGSWGIVCSDPTYKSDAFLNLKNPPNGSWGIVQIQPTKRNVMKNENPPNGSWGIVQIRPSFPQKVHVAEIAFDCVWIALFGGWI